ncbi:hypothetical protein Tco_1418115 [Tanacetum coccineum]
MVRSSLLARPEVFFSTFGRTGSIFFILGRGMTVYISTSPIHRERRVSWRIRILRDVEAEADGWERSDFPIISKDTWCKIHDKYNSNQPVHQVLVTKASSRMLYVLFSGKRWIKNNGSDFYVEFGGPKKAIKVFVDHPSYHRPGNPYGDIYGAFGDNKALRVDKDIQGSQDHSGRIDEERNGESMLWPEVAGKGSVFEIHDTSRRVCI